MKIDVLTLFPEMFDALNASLTGKHVKRDCIRSIATIFAIIR